MKHGYKNADTVFFKTKEDIQFAVNNNMVKAENAVLVPFGVEIEKMPADRAEQKKKIYDQYKIPENAMLLFFNGALDYKPNTDALYFILNEINPLLLKEENFIYRILISGKGLPLLLHDLKNFSDKNVIYAGFVDDVYACFKAADIFINPVITGGGVKTKIVEAIGFGTTVISGNTGAAGLELSACEEKIKIVADNNANAFVTAILQEQNIYIETPASYYTYYYWGSIIKRLLHLFKD